MVLLTFCVSLGSAQTGPPESEGQPELEPGIFTVRKDLIIDARHYDEKKNSTFQAHSASDFGYGGSNGLKRPEWIDLPTNNDLYYSVDSCTGLPAQNRNGKFEYIVISCDQKAQHIISSKLPEKVITQVQNDYKKLKSSHGDWQKTGPVYSLHFEIEAGNRTVPLEFKGKCNRDGVFITTREVVGWNEVTSQRFVRFLQDCQ
jgi:hypothetical protein